ncbi:hypothetical protein OIU85_008726, partial [Salix viminalis]
MCASCPPSFSFRLRILPTSHVLPGGKNGAAPALRPLNLEDFIQSKAKVGPSVSFDAASMNELRKWNEQYGE